MTVKKEVGNDGNSIVNEFRVRFDPDAVRERLRSAIRDAGGNQAVAAKSGVPLSTIGAFLGGRTEIRAAALAALADACGFSLDWLYGREGAVPGDMRTTFEPDLASAIAIPRFDCYASAGHGEKLFEEPPQGILPVPREMLRNFTGNTAHLAATDLRGDSMEPTLHDGDLIIFDRSARQVDREGVYVLTVGDDLFVKRLRRIPTPAGMALSLISDNTAYPEVRLDPDTQERVRIHGRVIWPNTSRRL